MSQQSGATNRQRHREAERGRRVEEDQAPRSLANLSPEDAAWARAQIDRLLWGVTVDPDAPLAGEDI